MKKGDLSKFIEEAVRWRIFHQTVGEAREAFADVPQDKLQKMIGEAVEDVRAKRYRERARQACNHHITIEARAGDFME
jgi:hypothetical protein